MLLIAFFASCSAVHIREHPTKSISEPAYDKMYAVASWYGSEFHGRPTSSGEIFNMYAKTCAHKEYPFGTRVQVTNVLNNRSAECIVNDRGPFVEGRDIDLSYAMAKEIELIGPGTGKVLLEVNGRDSSYIRPVKFQTSEKTGPFAVQVGAFTENINAIQLKAALKLKYPNVYIQEGEVKGATYYRVRVGNFADYNAALSIAEQLGQEGYQALLMKADVKI
ncbi:MAG: septal ring lytic transglycosylase RlpA family protein [Nitrospira bacterium HGW-Nitrospira-1]|nr:MAG: septal ring lytic transglycosylase RlpA family protein [Nitrospira bacterium HGW-Nitrospira-1]